MSSAANRGLGRSGVVVGTMTASIAFVMELTLIPVLLGTVQADLGISVSELSWVFNSYAIAVAIAVLASGLIGDIADRKRVFVAGVAVFACGSFISAFSGSFQELIAGRIVQGIGGGLFSPLVPVILTGSSTGKPGRILMIWGVVVGIAAAAFPLVGDALVSCMGWRSIFHVIAIIAVCGGLLSLRAKSATSETEQWSVASLGVVLRDRRYIALLAYVFLTYGCFSAFLFFVPLAWGETEAEGAWVPIFLTCLWVSFSGTGFALRNRVEGRGLGFSLLAAPVLFVFSFGLVALDIETTGIQLLSAASAGAGLACCLSPTTQLLLKLSPKNMAAFSSSMDITFARFGGVVMVALLAGGDIALIAMAVTAASVFALCASKVFLSRDPEAIARA